MTFHLSVIVPVYNVERFLSTCLDSIINNSWGEVTYEIIIVDDASPDGSLKIAKDYAEAHKNIVVIEQENKGLGGARNTGIKNARGNYLFFLDSDDFLLPNKMQNILYHALQDDLDIIEFGAIRVNQDYKKIDQVFQKSNSNISDGLHYAGKYNFENSACNKLYKRQFLTNNKIEFFEKTYIEDAPFNAEAYYKAKRVKSVSDVPVAYYQNSNSITRQKREGENLKKFIIDSIKVTDKINQFAVKELPKEALRIYKRQVAMFVSGIILMVIRSNFPSTEKKRYIVELSKLKLYPIASKSGVLKRDIFIFLVNKKFILNSFLRMMTDNL